jgi:hypothetical protein
MNILDLSNQIARYLARFQEQVEIMNEGEDFDINRASEDILVKVLNETLDIELVNANRLQERSYPAIDLIDKKRKIGVQITSLSKLSKVKKTIERFYSNSVFNDVSKVYIYVITQKQKKYSENIIRDYIKSMNNRYKRQELLDFSSEYIIDKADVYRILKQKNSIEKLTRVKSYLAEHFGEIQVTNDLTSYYQELRDSFNDVVFNDESGMTLSDIYIDPFVAIFEDNIKREEKFYSTDFPNFKSPKKNILLNDFLLSFFNDTYGDYFFRSNLLIIFGYPGQGKTSALKKLLNSYLDKKDLDRDIFFIKLKDIRNGRGLVDNPIKILHEEVNHLTEVEIPFSRFKKSILLLDGLDELYMKDNMTLDDIERVCKEISRELLRNVEMKVVVTSRHGYIELPKIKNESFLAIIVKPFLLSQQISWLAKYQKFHINTSLTLEQLESVNSSDRYLYRDIKEFLSQPILLQMIAGLKGKLDFEKIDRSEIYDRLFTELIERKYSEDGRLENFAGIEKQDLRALIQNVAFFTYRTGSGYITKRQLLSENEVAKFLTKFPNSDFRKSLKGILISFYFKELKQEISDDNMAIEFLHRSLMEYMTAEKIVIRMFDRFLDKNTKGDYIIDNYEDAWKELNYIFAYQTLSYEVNYYLEEMLYKRMRSEKNELAQRLAYFFNDFSANNFLLSYSNSGVPPFLMAVRNFSAFWFFLMLCDPSKNHINSTQSKESVKMFLYLAENNFRIKTAHYDFSNQDFSDTSFNNYWFDDYKFVNTKFDITDFFDVKFYASVFEHTSFVESEFGSAEFYNCKFDNANFDKSIMHNVKFEKCSFDNLSFNNCTLIDVVFKNCKKIKTKNFDGAILNRDMIIYLIKNRIRFNYSKCYFLELGSDIPIRISREFYDAIVESI